MSSEGHWSDTTEDSAGTRALALAGLGPIRLESQRGLALINGTHLMAARAALLVGDFEQLFNAALTAAAMSIDACRHRRVPRRPGVLGTGSAGARRVAQRLRELLDGSEVVRSHIENDPRVRDPYSSVAARGCWAAAGTCSSMFARPQRGSSAVTDNPLVFAAGRSFAGRDCERGNFHGMPIALPLDSLSLSIAHVAGSPRGIALYHGRGRAKTSGPPAGVPVAQERPAFRVHDRTTPPRRAATIVGLHHAREREQPRRAPGWRTTTRGPAELAKAERALTLALVVVSIELLCAPPGSDITAR